jgi:hypothetical protein
MQGKKKESSRDSPYNMARNMQKEREEKRDKERERYECDAVYSREGEAVIPAAAARRAESIRRALAGSSVRRPTKRETAALKVIEDIGNLQMRRSASAEHNRPDSSFKLPASRVEHSRSRAESRAQRQVWRGDVDVKLVSRRGGSITVFG